MESNVFIALGSNLNDPKKQSKNALIALNALPKSRINTISSLYKSRPLGNLDQNPYLNAVIQLKTALNPNELLKFLQKIEQNQGRIRTNERWNSRTLDLDILLFNNEIIKTKTLEIPHYDLMNREFVLYPLFEIAPELIFPNQIKLKDHIKNIDKNGLTFWD